MKPRLSAPAKPEWSGTVVTVPPPEEDTAKK